MVLYTVIWGPADQDVVPTKPYVQVYHAFAGKRVKIKLLSWSGALSQLGTTPSGCLPDVIRLDFGNELQAYQMGGQAESNSLFKWYFYPNSFYVDPIQAFGSDSVAAALPVVGIQRAAKPPTITGVLVGNTFTLTLNSISSTREETPDSAYGYILDQFWYYKAELDIEEI